jgi:putative ABC transport system permease protein
MKKGRMIKSGLRVIRRHKVRSVFMILGIAVGITALIITIALGKGAEEKIMTNIERIFSASNIVITAGAGQMMSGTQSMGTTTFTMEDVEVIQEEIDNIDIVDAVQVIEGRQVKYLEKSINTVIWGHSVSAEIVWNRTVTNGEFFDEMDIVSSARVALIGPKVAQTLFGNNDPVGEQIRIGTIPCRVKGVLEAKGVDPHGIDMDEDIWVPISTMLRRIMNVDYLMMAKMEVLDREQMDETVTQIKAILRERHNLTENEPDDFGIITPKQVREMVSTMNRVFTLFLPIIAAISLLVGGVIVLNLMLISVNERIGEIGLRKAVGARSKDILLQFLIETVVITSIGGIIGLILGFLGTHAASMMMSGHAIIPIPAIVMGLIFSMLVGLAAGLLPAKRAAALEPARTLQ